MPYLTVIKVKGKGDGSIFNNIKMLINRTVPFTSVWRRVKRWWIFQSSDLTEEELVAVQGFEPRTLRIWAACSDRLSYTAKCNKFLLKPLKLSIKLLESSEKFQKSLITYLPAGRQGLWNNYTDTKCIENIHDPNGVANNHKNWYVRRRQTPILKSG